MREMKQQVPARVLGRAWRARRADVPQRGTGRGSAAVAVSRNTVLSGSGAGQPLPSTHLLRGAPGEVGVGRVTFQTGIDLLCSPSPGPAVL